jgi:hypothetical protein
MASLASVVQQLKVERIRPKDGSNNSTKRCKPLAVSADCVEAGGVAGDLSGHGGQCRRRLAGESPRRNVPAGPDGGLVSEQSRRPETAT